MSVASCTGQSGANACRTCDPPYRQYALDHELELHELELHELELHELELQEEPLHQLDAHKTLLPDAPYLSPTAPAVSPRPGSGEEE